MNPIAAALISEHVPNILVEASTKITEPQFDAGPCDHGFGHCRRMMVVKTIDGAQYHILVQIGVECRPIRPEEPEEEE